VQLLFGFVTGTFIGIGLHILADMFNPTGIPVFMPIANKKISIGNMRTGSKEESVLRFFMLALDVVFSILCISMYLRI
jgi:membrane-bound metal-dependent hydrolase YbcI (DUF457 family)